MIAISLWQPWASAIACGLKRFETRAWAAEWRGPLAIHAAKRDTPELRAWWMLRVKPRPDFMARFALVGVRDWVDLPKGAIVCTARLVRVETTAELVETGQVEFTGPEFHWGNFAPEDDESGRPRYGWEMADVVPLNPAPPARGWQNFFTWDPATNETVGLAPSWKGGP